VIHSIDRTRQEFLALPHRKGVSDFEQSGIKQLFGGCPMHFGPTSVLGSAVRILTMALAVSASTSAQSVPPAETTPSTPPPAAGQTSDANPPQSTPPGAQEPSDQDSSGQQPAATEQQPANAPDTSANDSGRFVFKKQVQEVVLHATVVDDAGHLVTSLDQSAFSVSVNGVSEPITSFRREDLPVAMGIVIDNSGSMRDKREKVNQAVLNLIRISNPQDEIFVVNFSQKPYLDQDFTSDVNLLQAALHQVSTRGSTALYDAVVASATHLRNNPRLDKKVLLVITDGKDNMSQETLQEAIRKLQPNHGATVYAIGLADDGLTRAGRDALQNLATSTGGVAFFPQSLNDVDDITRTVAHDIRSQYTLAFKPASSAQKSYQSIRVEAKGSGRSRLTVRTRSGYYPGETVR
jgi:Ca-activated chloride channel family protein